MNNLAKQSELLFIWDASMCNPNGDMSADNAPRFDDVDQKAIVSDVRLKRTIRDDLQYRKEKMIFINNEEIVAKGLSAEQRFDELKKEVKGKEDIKEEEKRDVFLSCIDNRVFGGVAPNSGLQLIGPVQFSWTKSLNQTETVLKSGTGAFATTSKVDGKVKHQKTFRADNYIPFGLFATYGTINRIHAQNTGATEEDAMETLDSLWFGTKFLNTRSKEGQKPRMLMRIVYKDDSKYFIGLLDELVKLNNEDTSILRNVNDAELDFTRLFKVLSFAKDHIDNIWIVIDPSLEKYEAIQKEWESTLKGISVNFVAEDKIISKKG